MVWRRSSYAAVGAVGLTCALILSAVTLVPARAQFGDLPFPGDLVEPGAGPAGAGVRALDLLDPSEAARADTEAVLEPLAEALTVDYLIIGPKLMLQGEPSALGRVESLLAELGVVAERYVCETVPLYYVRDADSVKRMLSELKQAAAEMDEVSVTTTAAQGARPSLVLYGPRPYVEDLRRVLGAIDVPHPEVRLDIWAFQISGSDARRVADRAETAQGRIETVAGLIRGYLQQLERCALDEQERNREPAYTLFGYEEGFETAAAEPAADEGEAETNGNGDSEATESTPGTWDEIEDLFNRLGMESSLDDVYRICMGIKPIAKRRVAVVPSARGLHPLSLTETLATLILTRPRDGGVEETVEADLRQHLAEWLATEDIRALTTWHRLLQQACGRSAEEPLAGLADALGEVVRARQEGTDEREQQDAIDAATEALLPSRLLSTFRDARYVDVAQATLSEFLLDWRENATDWRSLPPDRLRRRAADARVVLQAAEHALAGDIRTLFLAPLIEELRALATQGGRNGLASASTTSISALSGTRAEVIGSGISYFDVEAQPELDVSPALPGLQVPSGLKPALRKHPAVWSILTSGAELSVTPQVLPGGGSAELEIALTVSHPDHEVISEGPAPPIVPLSRVAQHTAGTRVYVNSLDVFALSSFSLRTTQPRTDLSVPVLSRIPFLGRMFRLPRPPKRVHHESMLLIVSTILPTGMDLGTTLDFETYEEETPLG